jgi:hypothetical protein
MKKRVMAYLLSAASVYLTMGYLTQLFISMINSFSFNVI